MKDLKLIEVDYNPQNSEKRMREVYSGLVGRVGFHVGRYRPFHKPSSTRSVSPAPRPGIPRTYPIASLAPRQNRSSPHAATISRERFAIRASSGVGVPAKRRSAAPICANCKKIRNDKGYWQGVEGYISEHTDATFTHGMCPDCIKEYFPNFAQSGHEKPID